jgi:hypothetical protein
MLSRQFIDLRDGIPHIPPFLLAENKPAVSTSLFLAKPVGIYGLHNTTFSL